MRSLIAMAHSLGLKIIAEGIETVEQAEFLLAEMCEEGQGFLYAKPLPATEFEAFLRTNKIGAPPEMLEARVFGAGSYATAGKPSQRRRSNRS